jgi:hypothetical protein
MDVDSTYAEASTKASHTISPSSLLQRKKQQQEQWEQEQSLEVIQSTGTLRHEQQIPGRSIVVQATTNPPGSQLSIVSSEPSVTRRSDGQIGSGADNGTARRDDGGINDDTEDTGHHNTRASYDHQQEELQAVQESVVTEIKPD